MTKRKSIWATLMCVVLSVVMLFTMASCDTTTPPETTQTPEKDPYTIDKPCVESFKQLSAGDTIYVVPTDAKISVVKNKKKLQPEELIMATSLQGIVAQTQAQIYIGQMDDEWVTYLTENYGLNFVEITSLEELIDKFADYTNKTYVKFRYYESNVSVSSINAATTIASATKSIMLPIDEENDYQKMIELLENKGFTALDAGVNMFVSKDQPDVQENTMGDTQAIEKYKDQLSTEVVGVLNPMQKTSYKLRDYVIAMGAGAIMVDYASNAAMTKVYAGCNPLAIAFGNSSYNHPSYGAKGMFAEQWIEVSAPTATVPVLTSEMANLSLFAALPKDVGTQVATKDNSVAEDVHYVAVVLNYGNDISYWEDAASSNKKLANKNKGEYPVGYTMNASLYEFMPQAIKSAYSTMTDNELFIAAPSGFGMADLKEMAKFNKGDILNKYLERSNNIFGSAGLNYVSTYGSITDTAVLDKVAALSNVNGGFVLAANYETPTGGVYFSNDKVFIAAREVLRGDVYRTNKQVANDSLDKLVERLGTYSTDKTSADAYTLLQIESTASTTDYTKLIDKLYEKAPDNVRFVTPDQLLALIKANVAADSTLTQTVGCLNVAPTAQAVEITTSAGKQVKFEWEEYVSDANVEDQDKLLVNIGSRPEHGTAKVSGSKITYKPETGYTGTDTFEYTVSDGNEIVIAKVTVTIE